MSDVDSIKNIMESLQGSDFEETEAQIRADLGPENAYLRSLSLISRDFGYLVPRCGDVGWSEGANLLPSLYRG